MPRFLVSVQKSMYATGGITVEAKDEDKAVEKVQKDIDMGKIQTTSILWEAAEYEDCSFKTTGDCE